MDLSKCLVIEVEYPSYCLRYQYDGFGRAGFGNTLSQLIPRGVNFGTWRTLVLALVTAESHGLVVIAEDVYSRG